MDIEAEKVDIGSEKVDIETEKVYIESKKGVTPFFVVKILIIA